MTVDFLSSFLWTLDTYPYALLYFLLVISFYPYLSATLLYITWRLATRVIFTLVASLYLVQTMFHGLRDLQPIVVPNWTT